MPPSMGPNTGQATFAEALVTQPNPTFFMKLFGMGSVNVTARAVAGNVGGAKACGYLPNPTAPATLALQGAYTISGGPNSTGGTVPACGIVDDSNNANAVKVTESGGTLNTAFVATAGVQGGSGSTSPTTVTTGVSGLPGDPLASQVAQEPQPAGGCTQTSTLTTITTANEGSVTGSNANNVVCFSNAVTINNGVVLSGSSNGVDYVFENGVTIGVGSTVTFGYAQYDSSANTFCCTVGATMEISGGSLTQGSNSVLNIYAPTGIGSPINGIAIWQVASDSNQLQVQFGSNNQVLDGFIYAPGAAVTLHDNGGGVVATGFVANSLTVKSSSLRLPNYNLANAATTPLTQILLVE